MPFKDKEYQRVYRLQWYAKNKNSEIVHVTRRKKQIKIWLLNFKKELKCNQCGLKHPAIIDFHHKEKNKEKAISQMVCDGYSISRIKQEIKKCDILCSNCHRIIHFSKQ